MMGQAFSRQDLKIACWVILGVWLAYRLFPWLRKTAYLSRLPAPKGNWLFGHLSTMDRFDHHKVMTDWAAQLGGIYRMRMAWVHVSHNPLHSHSCATLPVGLRGGVSAFIWISHALCAGSNRH